MSINSALRIHLSVSYGMMSILVISRYAAPPYPAAPDFLHGKACHTILRSLCSLTARLSPTHNILRVTAFLQNMFAGVTRVPLPPLFRGRIKHLEASRRKRLYSPHGLLCPLEEGERWWRQPPKGECISSSEARLACFPRAKPDCPVFTAKGGIKNGARKGAAPPQRARSASQ